MSEAAGLFAWLVFVITLGRLLGVVTTAVTAAFEGADDEEDEYQRAGKEQCFVPAALMGKQ